MFKKIMSFWSEERSLTTLLVLLAINMFVLEPVIREGARIAFLRGVFSSLLLLAGLLTMTRHKTLRIVFAVFVILTMVVHWTRIAFGTRALMGWDAFFLLLSMLALMVIVLAQVNRKRPCHRTSGSGGCGGIYVVRHVLRLRLFVDRFSDSGIVSNVGGGSAVQASAV